MATKKSVGASECPVCLNAYTDPRFLPACGHSFCLKCIKQSAKDTSVDVVECPLCRKPSSVASEGFEGLPVNYALISLLENLSSDGVEDVSTDVKNVSLNWCTKHEDEELVLVCVDCWASICVKCQEETHNKHRMSSVSKFVADAMKKLLQDAKELNVNLSQIESQRGKLKGNRDRLLCQVTEQETAINKEYESVKLFLEKERSKLMEELISFKQSALKSIEHYNQEFEFHDKELRSLNSRIQEIRKVADAGANFATVSQLKAMKERLNNANNAKIEFKETETDIKFVPADLQSLMVKHSILDDANIIGKLRLNTVSHSATTEIYQIESDSGTLMSKLKQTQNIPVDSKSDQVINEPHKRNRQFVQDLTPQTSEASKSIPVVNRSLSQKFMVDEHLWHYVLFKYADKVGDISSRNLCEARVVSEFSKEGTSYFLEVSPYVNEISDANDAKNSTENAVEELVQMFHKVSSNPPIREYGIKLPAELDKTKIHDLKMALDRMGFLFMPSDLHRLIGPENRFEEAKSKVWEVVGEHQRKTLSALKDKDETLKFQSPNGLTVFVSRGDLAKQRVDAIVNPANSDLQYAREVANIVARKLDQECREYIRNKGSLKTTYQKRH